MQEMIIDSLTKPLGLITFEEFIKYLGLMTETEIEQE